MDPPATAVGPANKSKVTGALLYVDDLRVTFDGYKALRGLSLALAPGKMRAIIVPMLWAKRESGRPG